MKNKNGNSLSQQHRCVIDKDYKTNTVRLIQNKSEKVYESSRELGVNSTTLNLSKNQYLKNSEVSFLCEGYQTPAEDVHIKLLQENKVLQEERYIIKRTRKPEPESIFQSDRGVQYASNDVRELSENNHITQSMNHKGNCYDNAITESFFHTLKTELVYQTQYKTQL